MDQRAQHISDHSFPLSSFFLVLTQDQHSVKKNLRYSLIQTKANNYLPCYLPAVGSCMRLLKFAELHGSRQLHSLQTLANLSVMPFLCMWQRGQNQTIFKGSLQHKPFYDFMSLLQLPCYAFCLSSQVQQNMAVNNLS